MSAGVPEGLKPRRQRRGGGRGSFCWDEVNIRDVKLNYLRSGGFGCVSVPSRLGSAKRGVLLLQ